MKITKQIITDRQQIILNNKDLNILQGNTDNRSKVMLFLSYDITNSTELKVKYPQEWSSIINDLLSNKFEQMDFWKFNGDEILYKIQVCSIDFICEIIESSYVFLKTLQNTMQAKIKEITIKGTLWVAFAESNVEKYKHNFYFNIGEVSDFAGKHMDEGFRLTKCSSMTKMAIDPKITYILLETSLEMNDSSYAQIDSQREKLKRVLSNTYLIGYSKCKGVWDELPYPVYWYFNDGIQYGEYLSNEHLWSKKENIMPLYCNNNDDTINISYNNINRIYKSIGKIQEIQEIKDHLNGEIYESSEGKANLYYMVACVNPVSNKVLVAQRSINRQHLKHVWDFGNVKYQRVKMKEIIIKEYKNLFGIDIDLITDKDRGNNLKPFGYCTVYRNCKPHHGILCYAIIKTEQNDQKLISEINEHLKQQNFQKYDKVRFVDKDYNFAQINELTLDDIRKDSELAFLKKNEPFKNTSIMYFENSVKGAIAEAKKVLLRRRVYHYRKKLKR